MPSRRTRPRRRTCWYAAVAYTTRSSCCGWPNGWRRAAWSAPPPMGSIRITWRPPPSPGWHVNASSDRRATCRPSPARADGACWARYIWLRGIKRAGRLAQLRDAGGRQLRRPGERKGLQGFLEGRFFGEVPLPAQHEAARIEHGLARDLAGRAQAQAMPQRMQHHVIDGPVAVLCERLDPLGHQAVDVAYDEVWHERRSVSRMPSWQGMVAQIGGLCSRPLG